MPERLTYSVRDISILLGISIVKTYELVKSEGFPSIQLGRRIVIPVEHFNDWMEKQLEKPKI